MDEGVEETEEARVSSRSELDPPPHRGGHNSVMNDMECGHLIVPLAHNEEEGVEELCEFGEEVPPAAMGHTQSLCAVRVHGLTAQTVAIHPSTGTGLVEDPPAEDDLDGIVDDQNASQLERLAVLHQLWTDDLEVRRIET